MFYLHILLSDFAVRDLSIILRHTVEKYALFYYRVTFL